MNVPLWVWIAFHGLIFLLLALDLGVLHRRAREVTMREALTWSAVLGRPGPGILHPGLALAGGRGGHGLDGRLVDREGAERRQHLRLRDGLRRVQGALVATASRAVLGDPGGPRHAGPVHRGRRHPSEGRSTWSCTGSARILIWSGIKMLLARNDEPSPGEKLAGATAPAPPSHDGGERRPGEFRGASRGALAVHSPARGPGGDRGHRPGVRHRLHSRGPRGVHGSVHRLHLERDGHSRVARAVLRARGSDGTLPLPERGVVPDPGLRWEARWSSSTWCTCPRGWHWAPSAPSWESPSGPRCWGHRGPRRPRRHRRTRWRPRSAHSGGNEAWSSSPVPAPADPVETPIRATAAAMKPWSSSPVPAPADPVETPISRTAAAMKRGPRRGPAPCFGGLA